MNNESFLKEAHSYINTEFEGFKVYQDIVKDIFIEFNRVCRENQIKYFTAFGSLLGIIRDHGFIPWDYDMDVMIDYADLDRLQVCLEEKLGEDYYYVYITNMKDYPLPVLRVCKKGYTYMSFHVDVFFLTGCPGNEIAREKYIKKVNKICQIRMDKFVKSHSIPQKETTARRVYTFIRNLETFLMPVSVLEKREKKLFGKYPVANAEYCISISNEYHKHLACLFGNNEDIEVDGIFYSVPVEYDKVLREEYGDYNEYMPIRNRFEEFYTLKRYIEDNQEYYLKYLRHRVEE